MTNIQWLKMKRPSTTLIIPYLTEAEILALNTGDRRSLVDMLAGQKVVIQDLLDLLVKTCSHTVDEIPGDYYAKDEWRTDGATCAACGKGLGWYCTKAPDHYCHYDEDGDPCRNSCLHCGMPYDRG